MSCECINDVFLRDTFHLLISKNYSFGNSLILGDKRTFQRRKHAEALELVHFQSQYGA